MLLRNSIYRAIRQAILMCEFEPGQQLREQMLAERYRVSRSPVRDALLRLEVESLVTVLPRQGYLVNAISMPDVEAMFDLRLVITSACAAGAARADDDAVRGLERLRGDPDDELSDDNRIETNRAFHFALADICGNARVAALERDLAEQFCRLVRIVLREPPQNCSTPMTTKEHNAIIDAIQAHDPATVSRLAYQHTQSGYGRVMAALRKGLAEGLVGRQPVPAPPERSDDSAGRA
jgi:DNA-binding GntR family transcriptional regulator